MSSIWHVKAYLVYVEMCHTERSEVSPEEFSHLAELFGDSHQHCLAPASGAGVRVVQVSLPSVVKNDKII